MNRTMWIWQSIATKISKVLWQAIEKSYPYLHVYFKIGWFTHCYNAVFVTTGSMPWIGNH